jgi:hypothetical protein
MAKVIERVLITEHKTDALLFASAADFTPEELNALETRYPGIQNAMLELEREPSWVVGMLCPMNFGTDEKPSLVVFMCLGPRGYFGIRECVRKLASKASELKIRHVACGRLGTGKSGTVFGAIEPVIAAVEGGSLNVDIYRGNN